MLFESPGDVVAALWDGIKASFAEGVAFVSGTITKLLDFLGLTEVAEAASGIFGSVLDSLLAPLDILKGFINMFIIDPLNSILSWAPFGGTTLAGFVGVDTIPSLQGGGITTQDTVAQLHKGEAVIPLGGPAQVQELQQRLTTPILSAAAIQQAIMVELDPDTTDRPVREEIMESNKLLRQMLAETRGRPTTGGGGARTGVSESTRRFGRGDF